MAKSAGSGMDEVAWGILGPGGIARAFATGISEAPNARLAAIASRNPMRRELAEDFAGARILEGYQALIDDREVEAIYIATPHPFHAEWAVRAARAGKHLLVEKPLAVTEAEAQRMVDAARERGTFLGEAFMYRLHPQTAKLVELIGSGTLGTVRMVKSSFGFALPFDPAHRLYANELAGGGILDVGCYPVSMVRLLAGAAAGEPYLDPETVHGVAHLGQTGVDEWASAVLKFANGILAEVSCSVALDQDNMLRIFGTMGQIEVADFWFAGGRDGGTGQIVVDFPDGEQQIVGVEEPKALYAFEVEAASAAIREGRSQFSSPGPDWADSLGNMRVLDKWRADVGLVYEFERNRQA